MLGMVGAIGCMAAGAALGSWLREKHIARLRMLRALTETVGLMRILLEEERPPMPELLSRCAACAGTGAGCDEVAHRLLWVSENLTRSPLCGMAETYNVACMQFPMPWEQAEERTALERLFAQLGNGSAAMRQQAAVNCLHQLRPLLDSTQAKAERDGRLCIQLGLLLGLMAGIVLW